MHTTKILVPQAIVNWLSRAAMALDHILIDIKDFFPMQYDYLL